MLRVGRLKVIVAVVLVTFLLFGALCPPVRYSGESFKAFAAAANEEKDLQNDGVVRPEELGEGLSRKSYEEISDRRVTVRQPVMEVTDRNVERQTPELLGDTFCLYDDDGTPHEGTEVTFDGELGSLQNPKYPCVGLKDNDNYFTDFQKYMLLRQSVYYNKRAMTDAANGTLKKHPASDYIYGEISPEAKAVEKHIVTDPIYLSPMTTGLYLAPGETATVVVSGLKEGQSVTLYTHHQDTLAYRGNRGNMAGGQQDNGFGDNDQYLAFWDNIIKQEADEAKAAGREPDYSKFDFGLNGQWKRQNQKVPCMGAEFTLNGNGTYKIGCIYGGPLYVKPTPVSVDLTVTGALETPHFILGVTTVEEFNEYLSKAPGLIATLDCENGQLIGYSEYMRECDDIEKLAYFWHSVFAINASFNGRAYNYNVTLAYDMHVPAGSAVALSANFAAQPAGWFKDCMNYEVITTHGNWGTFHELGHIHAATYGVNWGMNGAGEGEVWNNTLIIIIYTMLCNMDNRMVSVEHGEFTHPFLAVNKAMNLTQNTVGNVPIEDYNDYDKTNGAGYFDQLSLYANLIHAFGPERFVDFLYTYSVNKAYCTQTEKYTQAEKDAKMDKRADFVYRIGLVDHVNILKWVNEFYHANLSDKFFTDSQWEYLSDLPDFYPIAYRWANGVDGNETARKYEVDGKFSTVFDLSDGNVICPVSYDILGVSNPKKGTIECSEDFTKVVYTPPKEVTDCDSFDILVRTLGGRLVTLNVRFRLLYRNAHSEVYSLDKDAVGASPSVDTALDYIKDKQPERTEDGSYGGKARFTGSGLEYYRIKFKYLPENSGDYKFYILADDAARVTFIDGDGNNLGTLSASRNYSSDYKTCTPVTLSLQAGKEIAVDCHFVNWGGLGYLRVGVQAPGEENIIDIPVNNIINIEASAEEAAKADEFKAWEPEFLDSIKNTPLDYASDKSIWKVVEAPDDNGYAPKENMVDGKESTFYHAKYAGSPPPYPHDIVIDTGAEQMFNYFNIVTRTSNSNNYIHELALYGSASGEEGTYTELFKGDSPNPDSHRIRINFEEVSIRYFKLSVIRTAKVTAIAEVSGGFQKKLEQTVKPTNFQKENDGFTENSANGKLTAKNANSTYVFEFLGSGFDIFCDTAPEGGRAKVYIDEVYDGEINLNGERIFNKCAYVKSGMKVENHTVKIVVETAPFNISFINVTYGVPVEEKDYPATGDEYGDTTVALEFPFDWRTHVTDFKTLESIAFCRREPEGYDDTFIRLNGYIRVYRSSSNENDVAFVYPGDIVSPNESGSLFAGCAALESIDFANFDTAGMRGAVSMFNGCSSLKEIDLSNFNTESTLFMANMFLNCSSLSFANLGGLTFSDGANLNRFFEGCENLSAVVVPKNFADGAEIKLMNIYLDEQAIALSEKITSANAGHTLTLHSEHQFVRIDEVPAKCLTDGVKAHEACKCGLIMLNGENADEEALTIPALGHSETTVSYEEPTCVQAGHTEGKICSRCGEVLDGVSEIPALGHSETTVPGKEATYDEAGLTDGKICSRCGEVLEAQTEIPKLEKKANVLAIALGTAGGVLAFAAAAAIIFLKKRKRS